MKLFLIKIGKTLNVIRQDGLINGIARIAVAFFGMFQKVGRGDVLFVTNGIGDSARYRTRNISEELKAHGLQSSVTVQDNPMLLSYVSKFKIFVFHRALFTARVKKMIEKIKQRGGEIIFEADDLVFDPKYFTQLEYFKNMNQLEKKLYERGLGGEILKDPYVKICTTTTSCLAKILEGYGKKVFIVPNKLSDDDLKIADKIIKYKTLNIKQCYVLHAPCSMIKIGYFSGTKSHDRDFATIADALVDIMKKFPDVRLVLAGPLDTGQKLVGYESRIRRLAYVPRKINFENIASVDINIVPLEIGDPFCESKSELKFFEAGILGGADRGCCHSNFP